MTGFTFWGRDALNKFASEAMLTLRKISEITDNNNPASVMHDDPRKALELVQTLSLGLNAEAAREIEPEKIIYAVKWKGAGGCECLEVFGDQNSAHMFLDNLGSGGIIYSMALRGPAYAKGV
jgi:hypothetical protein